MNNFLMLIKIFIIIWAYIIAIIAMPLIVIGFFARIALMALFSLVIQKGFLENHTILLVIGNACDSIFRE